MTVNFDLIDDTEDRAFSQRVYEFVERTHGKFLRATVEGSVWHREENVWVHTEMVLNQFIRLAKDMNFTSKMFRTGFLVSIYHDVGKPMCMRERDDKQGYSFYNHESASANWFKNDYCRHREVAGFLSGDGNGTLDHMQFIRFLIQVHLPYSQSTEMMKLIKASVLYYGSELFTEEECVKIFTVCLLSDACGRISDNYAANTAAVLDWIGAFSKLDELPKVRSKNNGPQVYILSGSQGSGKTTFAKSLRSNTLKLVHYLSFDDLRAKLFLEKTGTELNDDNFHESDQFKVELQGRVTKTLNRLAGDAQYNDDLIIVDATQVTRKRRMMVVNNIRNCQVVIVEFVNSIDRCIELNDLRKPPKTGYVPVVRIKQNYFSTKMPMIDEFNRYDKMVTLSN